MRRGQENSLRRLSALGHIAANQPNPGYRAKVFPVGLFLPPAVLPPASPPPLHPRRGEGELEYPILFFCFGEVFLNRGVAVRVYWPRLGNDAVVVNGLMIGVAAAVGAVVFLLVMPKVTAATTARATRQQACAR